MRRIRAWLRPEADNNRAARDATPLFTRVSRWPVLSALTAWASGTDQFPACKCYFVSKSDAGAESARPVGGAVTTGTAGAAYGQPRSISLQRRRQTECRRHRQAHLPGGTGALLQDRCYGLPQLACRARSAFHTTLGCMPESKMGFGAAVRNCTADVVHCYAHGEAMLERPPSQTAHIHSDLKMFSATNEVHVQAADRCVLESAAGTEVQCLLLVRHSCSPGPPFSQLDTLSRRGLISTSTATTHSLGLQRRRARRRD